MGKILNLIATIAIIFAIGTTIFLVFDAYLPATIQYNRLFGSDISMATQGATTLTGPDSIQDYLNRIWVNMNATFDMRNSANIYNSPWYWEQIPENSLAKQNSYFNSLNTSLTQRQSMVDAAIARGVYMSSDPVQTAVNQTRQEMNAYGGLNWVLENAWFLQFASTAYWAIYWIVIVWVIAVILVFIAFIAN